MKMRFIAVIYTIIMAVVLRLVLNSFTQNDFERRDVVFYNDVIEQINDSYNSGKDIKSIEQEFDCDIVLFGDDDYTSTIYKYYGTYGLVADFAPDKATLTDDNTKYAVDNNLEELINEDERDNKAGDLINENERDNKAEDLINKNERGNIAETANNNNIIGKICFASEENAFTDAGNNVKRNIIVIWCVILSAGYILMLIIYINYIRPFHELQHFTTEVAKGNLDVALPIHKENMFGAFTESFDVMREELAASRKREAEIEKSKKELVAQLSHDIKTPVATIKATCEVLEMKEKIKLNKLTGQMQDRDHLGSDTLNSDDGKVKKLTEDNLYGSKGDIDESKVDEIKGTLEKIGYISDKADTIDQLISNMFHATLEELEVLEVKAAETDSRVLNDIFSGMSQTANIIIENDLPECLVYMDKLRMEQVIGNVVGNSVKYAGTDINVSYMMCEENTTSASFLNGGLHNADADNKGNMSDYLKILIRDFGTGIPEEDIYKVTEKFYRGQNAAGKQGSGLGLYLARFFMEKQMGGFECYNYQPDSADNDQSGFVVELYLRKV